MTTSRSILAAAALAACLPAAAASACDHLATFDPQPVGASWGAAFGSVPGDLAFVEDGIAFHVVPNAAGNFILMQIDPAFPGWGSGNILELSNINTVMDLSGFGCVEQVTIEYLDLGGIENLRVNGAPMYVGDIPAAPAMIAPGISCSVSATAFGGGIFGEIKLTAMAGASIDKVELGGQEFWIDDVCVVRCDGPPPPGDCDHLATFDPIPLGASWGAGFGTVPGELAFVDDGIPFRVFPNAAGAFNLMQIDPAFPFFGSVHVLELNNINTLFSPAVLGCVERVTFDFVDLGGIENLQVNGAGMFVGELAAAPFNIAPGVTCTVTTAPVGGGITGTVELVGQVDRVEVGGQELWIDDVCVELCDCVGDLDGDGMVGFSDLLAVISAWGPCAGCPADLDGSGTVDFADVLVLLAAWGSC